MSVPPSPRTISSPAPPAPRRRARPTVALAAMVVAVALALAACGGGGSATTTTDGSDPPAGGDQVVGNPLPAVSYETFDGDTVALEADGKPMVINFWASWCVPCITEMPAFEEVHQDLGDSVDFLGINATERAEAGLAMAEQTGVTYPLGRDPDGGVLRALGGINLPTTVIVAADGTVTEVHSGPLDAAELRALIDEAEAS